MMVDLFSGSFRPLGPHLPDKIPLAAQVPLSLLVWSITGSILEHYVASYRSHRIRAARPGNFFHPQTTLRPVRLCTTIPVNK